MRLTPFKINAIKTGVFGAVLLYLGIDLMVWQGPVWHAMYGDRVDQEILDKAPAVVYGEPITAGQLARHIAEQELLGSSPKDAAAKSARDISELLKMVKYHELRIRTRYNDRNLPECKEEAEQEVARLASREPSGRDFDAKLESQGYTRAVFTDKMEARMREQAQLERAIKGHVEVSDKELEEMYDALGDKFVVPASRPVKHIFFNLTDNTPGQAQAKAEEAYQKILANEDFAELAKQVSDDGRSAPKGGDLGVIYNTGSLPLPELKLFGQDAIPADTPVLVQSQWGWHVIIAGEIKEAHYAEFEECKESLRTAYISILRSRAAAQYFKDAYTEDSAKKHIQIHAK